MKSRIDRNFKRSLIEARQRYGPDRTSSESETVDVLDSPRQKQVARVKRDDS